jgi:hypothetical protein
VGLQHGFHATTAEAWEATNSTALTDDSNTITLHTHLRSIGNTRLLLFTVFVATAAWASIYHPTQCAILKNAARRSVIGGYQEEEVVEATGTADMMPHAGSRELQYSLSTYQDEQEDAEYAPVSQQQTYEGAALDDESEATINGLDDADEVIAFMPAEEIIIPDGPQRSMLCFLLCGNHCVAKRVNDFAEEHKAWGGIPGFIGFIIFLVALTEVIPLNLTWLSVLLLPDTTRDFFKLNTHAVKLCISEPFDFMVPFATLTVGLIGGMASFDFHPGCCAGFICFEFFFITDILLSDADLTESVIREAGSNVPIYMIAFITFGSIYAMIVFGACPSASSEHQLSFTFFNSHVKISFISMFARFMYVPSISPQSSRLSHKK